MHTISKPLLTRPLACLVGLLFFTHPGFGQIPPSPTAISQASAAGQTVNLPTGVPIIQAPLMTLPGRHLSVPIGLSYYAGGFKVQEIAGPMGLGWALNAGGVITRVVQGIPDDEAYGYSRGKERNWVFAPVKTSNGEVTNYSTSFLNAVGGNETVDYDGEPDMFYFNMLGRSGRFVLDGEGKAVLMPHQDIEIKLTKDSQGRFLSWKIRTEDGMIYEFGTTTSSRETTRAQTIVQTGGTETQPARTFVSSWYLARISSPQSTEQITFSYESAANVTYEYHNYAEYRLEGCDDDEFQQARLITRVTLQPPRRLIQIESALGTVQFAYTQDRADLPGQQALSQIALRDRQGAFKQRFRFRYGLFNSCPQSTPLGVDQPNCQRLRLDRIEDITDTPLSLYAFSYLDDANRYLPHRFSQHYDHWGYANRGAAMNSNDYPWNEYLPPVTLDGTTYPSRVLSPQGFRNSDQASQAYLLNRMTNAMGGYTEYTYEGHQVGADLNAKVGGARIRSIKTFDGQGLFPTQQVVYNYHNSGQSSGGTPTYGYKISYANQDCELVVRYAQSLVNLFDLNGAVIGYSKVSEQLADGSRTTSYFTNFGNQPDTQTTIYRWYNSNNSQNARVVTANLCGGPNAPANCRRDVPPYPPRTSYSWRRGLLTRQEQIDNSGKVVQSSTYGYNVQQPVPPRRTLYALRVEAFDAENPVSTTLYDNFMAKIFGTQTFDNFDYRLGVYGLVSEPVYMTYQIDSLFDQKNLNRAVARRTDYSVNDFYLAVKEATMTDSDGNTRKTTYRHPTDFRGAEQDKFGSNHLRDQHMHQVVLEQESLVNTDVVQRTERSYALSSDLVVPAWQKVYPEGSGQAWSTLFAHDAKGNLVQATQLGGAAGDYPTSYLYGYEETLPIATVEGATYGTVRNTFSASDFTRLQQDYLSDETLRSKLAPLRRISGSLATLYTYDPLVGRTSEVAPNGLVTYYEYDARNRLRFMLNHERKYTGQYQYHYRGEAQPQ